MATSQQLLRQRWDQRSCCHCTRRQRCSQMPQPGSRIAMQLQATPRVMAMSVLGCSRRCACSRPHAMASELLGFGVRSSTSCQALISRSSKEGACSRPAYDRRWQFTSKGRHMGGVLPHMFMFPRSKLRTACATFKADSAHHMHIIFTKAPHSCPMPARKLQPDTRSAAANRRRILDDSPVVESGLQQ